MRKTLFLALSAALVACEKQPASSSHDSASPAVYADRQCGGMPGDWAAQGVERGELTTYNRVTIGRSGMVWNDATVDRPTLTAYLAQVRRMTPQPITVLVLALDADCAVVASVRQGMNEKLQCRGERSHCVEYSQADWDKMHAPVSPPPVEPSPQGADVRASGSAGPSPRAK